MDELNAETHLEAIIKSASGGGGTAAGFAVGNVGGNGTLYNLIDCLTNLTDISPGHLYVGYLDSVRVSSGTIEFTNVPIKFYYGENYEDDAPWITGGATEMFFSGNPVTGGALIHVEYEDLEIIFSDLYNLGMEQGAFDTVRICTTPIETPIDE